MSVHNNYADIVFSFAWPELFKKKNEEDRG